MRKLKWQLKKWQIKATSSKLMKRLLDVTCLKIPRIVEKDSQTDLQSRWASHGCPPQKCETIEEICGWVLSSYRGGQDVKATCIRLSQRGLK